MNILSKVLKTLCSSLQLSFHETFAGGRVTSPMIIKSQILQNRHALEHDNLHSRLIFYFPNTHSFLTFLLCYRFKKDFSVLSSRCHELYHIFLSTRSHAQKMMNKSPYTGVMEISSRCNEKTYLSLFFKFSSCS